MWGKAKKLPGSFASGLQHHHIVYVPFTIRGGFNTSVR
jgi:hypothetical protein